VQRIVVRRGEALSLQHPAFGLIRLSDLDALGFEASARENLELVRQKFRLDSLDSGYLRVADAARAIGLADSFGSTNKFLSKFAHPTAGLVLGIMHQSEAHRSLQATLTTTGVYFAGQCTMVLEEIVQAMPAG
jgi:hypothetical protein